MNKKLICIFDTETSDKPRHYANAEEDLDNYPYLLQFAANLIEVDMDNIQVNPKLVFSINSYVKPFREGKIITIAQEAFKVHNIAIDDCIAKGDEMYTVALIFQGLMNVCDLAVCHNWQFDRNVMVSELLRLGIKPRFKPGAKTLCTMKFATDIVKIPSTHPKSLYKWPTLAETYTYITDKLMSEEYKAHDAMGDVGATTDVVLGLLLQSEKLQAYLRGDLNDLYV